MMRVHEAPTDLMGLQKPVVFDPTPDERCTSPGIPALMENDIEGDQAFMALPSTPSSSTSASQKPSSATAKTKLFFCTACNMVLNSSIQADIHLCGLRHRNQVAALHKKAEAEGMEKEEYTMQQIDESDVPQYTKGMKPRRPRTRKKKKEEKKGDCCGSGEKEGCCSSAAPSGCPCNMWYGDMDQPPARPCVPDEPVVTQPGDCKHHIPLESCTMESCYLRRLLNEAHQGSGEAVKDLLKVVAHPRSGERMTEAIIDVLHSVGIEVVESFMAVIRKITVSKDPAVSFGGSDVLHRLMQHCVQQLTSNIEDAPVLDDPTTEEYEVQEQLNLRRLHQQTTSAELSAQLVKHGLAPCSLAHVQLQVLLFGTPIDLESLLKDAPLSSTLAKYSPSDQQVGLACRLLDVLTSHNTRSSCAAPSCSNMDCMSLEELHVYFEALKKTQPTSPHINRRIASILSRATDQPDGSSISSESAPPYVETGSF